MDISDASNYTGHADQILTPRDEEEMSAILRRATEQNVPITFSGALTGLAGGACPQGGWSVSTRALRKLEVQSGFMRVGTGVLLQEVQAAAAASRQFYAPDPTQNAASIGGNISANASGSRSFRFGATRAHVKALRVVHADGRIAEYRRGHKIGFAVTATPVPETTKHSAGYELAPDMDWVDLIVGAEGTLGVVTEAELQLLPAPKELMGGVVFFPDEPTALNAVERWQPDPRLRMLEFLDRDSLAMMDVPYGCALMVEQEGEIDLDMTGALEDESWFGSSPSDRERFRKFRHGLAERVAERIRRTGFVKVGTDYAVARPKVREVMALYRRFLAENLRTPHQVYGHIGDAHLHINAFPSSAAEAQHAKDAMTDLAREIVHLGGTVGAEHGLGKRKAHMLAIQYSPQVIEGMQAVKRRLDPQWLLGRGTLFETPPGL